MSFLPLTFQLPFVNAAHFVDRRDLIDSFVVANARDTRESHRVARLVALRFLNAIECDLQHDLRLDDEAPAVPRADALQFLGHRRDLDVGETAVCLAYVD